MAAYRIDVEALKQVRANNPNNLLAKAIPLWKDYYTTEGSVYRIIQSHFNWEGRASRDLRELLDAGVLPDEGESEQGKTRRLY